MGEAEEKALRRKRNTRLEKVYHERQKRSRERETRGGAGTNREEKQEGQGELDAGTKS